jgi:hypothetical protein
VEVLSAYLPRANVGHSHTKGPLEGEAQFKGVTTDLNKIVDQRTTRCHGEGRREKNYISQLNKHFQVICKCSVILQHGKVTAFMSFTLLVHVDGSINEDTMGGTSHKEH